MKTTKTALAALLLTIAAVVALVAATAGSAKRSDVFKVAWIYVGPHNDAGWSQAHDDGRLAVQKAFGSKVQTTYKENIAPGPQLQQTVSSLVQQGYKMIFGTSYGFFDKKLAAKYPDVKFEQNVDSPATGQFAESKGVPWVGYDSNAQKFAPKSWLTAALYDWGVYYKMRVQQAMAGTWKPGFWYGNIKDGFTMLAPYGPKVDAATKAKIAAKEKAMENGSFNVFTGPLYDQSGKLRVPKGQTMKILKGGTNSLYGMNWLVKGVIGSPTGK